MTRTVLASITVLLFAAVSATNGGLPVRSVVKTLPLDKLPGVVMKSREKSEYLPGRIIVKLHDTPPAPGTGTTFGVAAVDKFIQRYNAQSVHQLFPPAPSSQAPSPPDEAMSRVYVMKFSAAMDPFQMAQEVAALPEVDYAEPWFIYPVDDVATAASNDSGYSKQWGFPLARVDSAWTVSQGDTSVVIGIVDTGVQWNHPDLAANIWTNPGESGLDGLGRDKRTNGVDDDGNNYIDDWHGADLAGDFYNNPTYDNDPTPRGDNTAHGTHVAGIASAVTNNGRGVAGVGYKCRILPVKVAADDDFRSPGGQAYIIMGFEGIKYAVDMGAKIINASWGGGEASQFEQDVIDYAVSHGAVVVAAAGNLGSTSIHYPAGYPGVFSVASTTTTDTKSSFSNYGTTIDVAAPGGTSVLTPSLWIYSTYYSNTYAFMSGTSMASPFVAGICGLVKSVKPSFTGLQAAEQVRVTCDNINSLNPSYVDLLGRGRVNAYLALTASSPSLRMTSFTTSDATGGNGNGALEPGETFTLAMSVTNFLQPTSPLATITITTSDTTVQIVSGVFPVGAVGMNGTADNTASPYQIFVKSGIPQSHAVTFKLLYSDAGYSDFQMFTVIVNPTSAEHDVNNVITTLTNIGRIGYVDLTNTLGRGLIYAGVNELFEGGLLIGYSSAKIVDNIRNPNSAVSQDSDFVSNQAYEMRTPGTFAAQEGSSIFTDAGALATNKIGLQVNQFSYAYTTPPDSDYIIIRYDIKNTTAGTLFGVYVGIFADWDMQPNLNNNKAVFERSRSLGYAWDTTLSNPNPLYCGIRALDSATGYRGLELTSADISRSGKFSWISMGVVNPVISGDIHMVVSSGPFTIAAGQKQMVAFALVAGKSLTLIRAHADAAKAKWDNLKPLVGVEERHSGVPEAFALAQNYPNPFNPATTIAYDLPANSRVTLTVYDVLGRVVSSLVDGVQDAGKHNVVFDASRLASGMYFYRLEAVEVGSGSSHRFIDVKKFILVK